MNQDQTIQKDTVRETRSVSPLVTIIENEKDIVLEAEMPGIERDSIGLELTGDELTIRGGRQEPPLPEGVTPLFRERCPFAYARTFVLGNEVSRDGIGAKYENGVLTVTIPKAEERRPRRIEIRD